MQWILVALLAAMAVWAAFNVNVFWRNRRRGDIGHAVESMLVLLEGGGLLALSVRGSPLRLELVRGEGEGPGVALTLRISAGNWSHQTEKALRSLCEAHSYECEFEPTSAGYAPFSVRLRVDDIWSPSAGAKGARLVNLVLDALGAASDVRLKLDLVGPRSPRLAKRSRAILTDARD